MKTIAASAAAVLLAASLAGCGGDHSTKKIDTSVPPTGQPTGIIQGTLQLVGGPPSSKPKPIAGTVTFTGPGGSTTKAQVDESGKFAIGLYPGKYVVRGTSPLYQDGKLGCVTAEPKITVVAGKTVTADLGCSIK